MHHIGLSIYPRWMVRFPLPVDLCEYSLLDRRLQVSVGDPVFSSDG